MAISRFDDFLGFLDEAHDVVATAQALLSTPSDWNGLLASVLAGLPEAELVPRVLDGMVADVEPRIFVFADRPGRYRIALNHFSRPRFDRLRAEGQITPHKHAFAFCTRILRGAYTHWQFDNRGALEDPDLAFRHVETCRAGKVYSLRHDEYHCVLDPQDDTVTLMVRGPVIVERPHPREPGLARDDILRFRNELAALLRRPQAALGG